MLNILEQKPVSSLDNSMSSPKKKPKKDARSQQIPKDFLENVAIEESSRNAIISQSNLTSNDTIKPKKIKLVNNQHTPQSTKNILLDPVNVSMNFSKTA